MGNNHGKLSMKMKRLFATLFCSGTFATALILTSCGGDGNSNIKETDSNFKKLPKNEILGDAVNISYEYSVKWNANEQEWKEALEENREKNANNSDKMEKNYQKITSKHKEGRIQIEDEANAAMEKEKATLIGKAIPFECEDGLGYEVVECMINDVSTSYLSFTYKLKPVDAEMFAKADVMIWQSGYKCLDYNGNTILDSNGNEIGGTFGLNNDSKSQLKSGETVEMKHGFSLGEPNLANFAKIKFVKP